MRFDAGSPFQSVAQIIDAIVRHQGIECSMTGTRLGVIRYCENETDGILAGTVVSIEVDLQPEGFSTSHDQRFLGSCRIEVTRMVLLVIVLQAQIDLKDAQYC